MIWAITASSSTTSIRAICLAEWLGGPEGPLDAKLPHRLSIGAYFRQPALLGQHVDHVPGEIHRAVPKVREGRDRIGHAFAHPLSKRLLQVACHACDIGRIGRVLYPLS